MSSTYDPSRTSDKDKVRYRIGDAYPTDANGNLTDPLFPDEEIESVLADFSGNVDAAVADLFPQRQQRASMRPNRRKDGGLEEEFSAMGQGLEAFGKVRGPGMRIVAPGRLGETTESEFG